MLGRLFRRIPWLLLTVICIAVDQITKRLAVSFLEPIDTKPLWEGVLHLTYLENKGAAFGMLKDHRWVFMVSSTVMIAALLVFLCIMPKKYDHPLLNTGLAFVVGGGIGNMIDRIAAGYVVDFIDFRLINFAIFNGADSFVCVGAGLIVLYMLFFDGRQKTDPAV